jgi:hypothetical protein
MTQISRPFQIALLAMVVLAGVWFFALHGHSSSSGSSPSASVPAAPAQPAKTGSSSGSVSGSSSASEPAAAPSSVYHGAAPGVEGLTRAIAKAHEAVATARRNEKQLAEKSAQASSPAATGGVAASSPAGTKTGPATAPRVSTTSHPTTASTPAVTKTAAPTKAASPVTAPNRVPARQALVEVELKQGAVVAILFWNPKSAVDVTVHRELQLLLAVHHGLRKYSNNPVVRRLLNAVGLELDSKIAVNEAHASQVASFGSITRQVQVFQTPTILILNKKGQTMALTGLNDAFAIQQAIEEVRHQ